MSKKMLIDASHPEETRVVVVDGTRVEELDFESRNKRQLRGNVYLARVTRVEPSLQAAFVEYGGNRHGFLAFSEIHPDYYQIPFEDRIALIEAEEAENIKADAEDEESDIKANSKAETDIESDETESDETDSDDEDTDILDSDDDSQSESDHHDGDDEAQSEDNDDDVAAEQEKTASTRRKRMSRRRYKIQEVIKRGQILLIQAVKEERGNKGAAMTTYLSLAGRYCVLMPNTPRGGGISRKIANGSDRKRLKTIMSDLDVPQGMGVIVRTAGAKRTKVEIKRDYDYLSRLWETVRETTLKSIAPALIHEEGDLVKRSIRDLYNKDIEEILVQGDEAYKTAKNFIKMLMPSHAKNVKAYKDNIPLFLCYSVEKQIEASLESVVQLRSGGYLVIHPTEALVSVDVNSGRSTRERNVERTALKTNIEAAEEVARQMRLRDLAGLVVIDFIDMDENRNNKAVEKRMKDALSKDRARVQMSRISQFGLMEISRQRRRRSLLEGSTANCEHCDGVGRKRTIESSALAAIRAIEEIGVRRQLKRIRLKVSPDVAIYIFNEKRDLLQHVDDQFDMFTELVGDDTLIRPAFAVESLESRPEEEDPLSRIEAEHRKNAKKERAESKSRKSQKSERADTNETTEGQDAPAVELDENGEPKKRRRRRGRRGGRGKRNSETQNTEISETSDTIDGDSDRDSHKDGDAPTAKGTSDPKARDMDKPSKRKNTNRRKAPARSNKSENDDADAQKSSEDETSSENETSAKDDKPKRARRGARRKAPTRKPDDTTKAQEDITEIDTAKTATSKRRRRAPTKSSETTAPSITDQSQDSPAAKSTSRRKAPVKKPKPDADTPMEIVQAEPAKSRKKAPAKAKTAKKAASKTTSAKAKASKTAPAKTAKAAKVSTQKAPSKKTSSKKATAKKAPTKTATAKTTADKKPPAKNAKAKAATTSKATEKTTARRKAPARKTAPARSTPAQNDPAQADPVNSKSQPAAETPATTPGRRKAPSRTALDTTPSKSSADVSESSAEKPPSKKRGWFGLRKKSD